MGLTYHLLKKIAEEGEKVGVWNSKPVFSCSRSDLKNLGSGVYYIVYDDNNVLVKYDGKWYEYGYVEESGSVKEHRKRRLYKVKEELETAPVVENSYVPGYNVEERPVGDVKIEIGIEEVLKNAREMAIDDFLSGFERYVK